MPVITLVPMAELAPGTYTVLVRCRSPNPSIVGGGDADVICPACSSLLAKTVPPEALGEIVFRCGCGMFGRV